MGITWELHGIMWDYIGFHGTIWDSMGLCGIIVVWTHVEYVQGKGPGFWSMANDETSAKTRCELPTGLPSWDLPDEGVRVACDFTALMECRRCRTWIVLPERGWQWDLWQARPPTESHWNVATRCAIAGLRPEARSALCLEWNRCK